MSILEKLSNIQQAIKVPKDKHNAFAGFDYRSAESILEKLKPFLHDTKTIVTLDDQIVEIATQAYVKATVKLIDLESDQDVSVSAYAREEKTRPKMSEGQLTGAASSYARKYALNGLLLLDDNKDPDSQDNSVKNPKTAEKIASDTIKRNAKQPNLATDKQRKLISDKLFPLGFTTPEEIKTYLSDNYGINGLLDKADAGMIIDDLISNEGEDDA